MRVTSKAFSDFNTWVLHQKSLRSDVRSDELRSDARVSAADVVIEDDGCDLSRKVFCSGPVNSLQQCFIFLADNKAAKAYLAAVWVQSIKVYREAHILQSEMDASGATLGC